MWLQELIHPGWGDRANTFHEGDIKYRTTKFKVPAVVSPKREQVAAEPAPILFGELKESVGIFPGKSQMPQGTSQTGHSHMRLSERKSHTNKCILSHSPDMKLDLSQSTKWKPVEPKSSYRCILPPKVMTI